MPAEGLATVSVSSVGPVSSMRPLAQAQPAAQAGFVVPAGAEPASPDVRGVTQSAPVAVSLMLAVQERVGAEAGDREARQHGQRLLAALAELQLALLSGSETDTLQELSRLSEGGGLAVDPALAQVIRSILLRARLEVARAARIADQRPVPGS